MTDALELDLTLSGWDQGSYAVELQVTDPRSAFLRDRQYGEVCLDLDQLRQHVLDHEAYGRELFEALFASANVRELYRATRAEAQQTNRPLRLRLFAHAGVGHLHDLRWETLRDDDAHGGWLLTNEQVRFSRYLSGDAWEPASPRAEGKLRALVVIANPVDLGSGGFQSAGRPLAALDVAAEIARAKASLGSLYRDEDILASDPAQPGLVTSLRLAERLREGYDVVYLACHGVLGAGGPTASARLLLERDDGSGVMEPAQRLIDAIRNLAPQRRPRLIVLASCESAGTGTQGSNGPAPGGGQHEPATADAVGALAAVGPGLARVGVPAVLAMQGSVSMKTLSTFVPTFFQELRADPLVDRAVAVARAAVAHRPDSWMPVLYLRLRDGSLWYTPRFADSAQEKLIWDRLVSGLKVESPYTPIVGPGSSEFLFGAPRQLSRTWTSRNSYPLAEQGRDEIHQVAQYLAGSLGRDVLNRTLIEHYRQCALDHLADTDPVDSDGKTPDERFELRVAQIVQHRRQRAPDDTCALLASLPFRVYINANPDSLLFHALVAAGKQPVVEYARWNAQLQDLGSYPSAYEQARSQLTPYDPSRDRPLIFHPFGHLQVPDSLVLSEDDFFDYLMWVNRPESQSGSQPGTQLPNAVGRALRESGLLFLGFSTLDWSFRVLFRSILGVLNNDRAGLPQKYRSVAVQVRPGENILNPDLARAYLEQYFGDLRLRIYWGSVDDFVAELAARARQEGLLP